MANALIAWLILLLVEVAAAQTSNQNMALLTTCSAPSIYLNESRNDGFRRTHLGRFERVNLHMTVVCQLRHVIEHDHLEKIEILNGRTTTASFTRKEHDLWSLNTMTARSVLIGGYYESLYVSFNCPLHCDGPGTQIQKCLNESWTCRYEQNVIDADGNAHRCSSNSTFFITIKDPWFAATVTYFADRANKHKVILDDQLVLFRGSKTKVDAELRGCMSNMSADHVKLATSTSLIQVDSASTPITEGSNCDVTLVVSFMLTVTSHPPGGHQDYTLLLYYDVTHNESDPTVNPSDGRYGRRIDVRIFSARNILSRQVRLTWDPPGTRNIWTRPIKLTAQIDGFSADQLTWIFWRKNLYAMIVNGVYVGDEDQHHVIFKSAGKNTVVEESVVVTGNKVSFELMPSSCQFMHAPGDDDDVIHLPLIKDINVIAYKSRSGTTLSDVWFQSNNWEFDYSPMVSVDEHVFGAETLDIYLARNTQVHHFKCQHWCPYRDSSVVLQFVNRRITHSSAQDTIVFKRNFSTRVFTLQSGCGFTREQVVAYPNVLYDGIFIGSCDVRCGNIIGKQKRFSLTVNNNVCIPNPCLNKGACIPAGARYFCNCRNIFEGKNCEKFRRCLETTCENGGTCLYTESVNGTLGSKCVCPYPFHGERCEIEIKRETLYVCAEHSTCLAVMTTLCLALSLVAVFLVDFISGQRVCCVLQGRAMDTDPYRRYYKALRNELRKANFNDDRVQVQKHAMLDLIARKTGEKAAEEFKSKDAESGSDNKESGFTDRSAMNKRDSVGWQRSETTMDNSDVRSTRLKQE